MDGYRALAEAFTEWVDANGWTQTDVVGMGGPSTSTQTKLRQGHGALRGATLRQVDRVMGWPTGTSQRVVQGAPAPAPALEKNDPAVDVVGGMHQTGETSFLYRRPPELSDAEWRDIKRSTTEYLEWTISKAVDRHTTRD